MTSPHLPLEICEMVIDECAEPPPPVHTPNHSCCPNIFNVAHPPSLTLLEKRTLLSCALTCKAWSPRSLVNLYRSVDISNPNKTAQIVDGLNAQRHSVSLKIDHADLVISVRKSTHYTRTYSSFNIPPRVLAGLPSEIRIPSLRIHSFDKHQNVSQIVLAANSQYREFLEASVQCFRFVSSLTLSNISFYTPLELIRLLQSLQSLRHLTLIEVTRTCDAEAQDILAFKDSFALDSFHCNLMGDSSLCQFVRAFININAFHWLRCFGIYNEAEHVRFPREVAKLLQEVLSAAGANLKRLEIVEQYLDFNSDLTLLPLTGLRILHIPFIEIDTAIRALSELSSQELEAIRLESVRVGKIEDIAALNRSLSSPRFASNSTLKSVYLGITFLERTGFEEVKKEEALLLLRELCDVYGERIQIGVME